MSFCTYIVADENNDLPESITSQLPNDPRLFRGKNAASSFMKYVISIANLIGDLMCAATVPMLDLNKEEKKRFKRPTNCKLCNLVIAIIKIPVQDHCHLTGNLVSIY